VSAEDARCLAPELGHDLEVDDLVSLDDYGCYARWSSGGHRHPAFSLRLDPPAPLDSSRIAAIAAASATRFGRPREEVAKELDQVFAARASKLGRDIPEEVLALAGAPGGRVQLSLAENPPLRRNEHLSRRRSS